MKSDVVIIGAGVAGLASGALLAKQGLRVTVLEKGNQAGGRAYTYEDKGFTLNFGAHAIYRPHSGLLGQIVTRLGIPDFEYGYPAPEKAFFADGERFGSLGQKPQQILTTPLFPLASRLRLIPVLMAVRSAKPESLPEEMTWGEWVERKTSDPLVRRFMLAFSSVNSYTADAATLSARGLLRHLKDNLFAKDYVGYMSGGWKTMYEAFERSMTSHGGQLISGAQVERLEVRDGAVVAAIAGGVRYEADWFVSTLPPQDAPALAEDRTPLRMELQRWERMADVRALCIDLGFNRRLRTDLTFIMDIERTTYFSLHSEVTPDLAPEGSQLLHAMAYLSAEDAASDAAVERRRQDVIAGLDRWFAGWREAAVVERTLPNTRVVAARRTPGQYGAGAVPLRAASASNLLFANDARDLPYHLSLTSMAAAMEVADAIAAEHREPAVGRAPAAVAV